ncbi:MAG TPA: YggT family protein [Candidatus Saccharimonadia bacterium]|nr:YggT family protein [Candidatus Saccharimonadia bacterium]
MIALVLVTFVDLFVPLFSGVLLLRVILSYVMRPGGWFMDALMGITEPALAPVRKLLPPAAGIDFAPLVVLLLLQGLQTFVDNLFR